MEQTIVDLLRDLGPYGILCLTLLVLAWMGRPLIEGLVAAMKAIQKTDETLQARLAESEARWAKSDTVVTDVTNVQSQTVTQMAELTRQMNTLVKGVGDFSSRYDARASVIDGIKSAQADHITASANASNEIKTALVAVEAALGDLKTAIGDVKTLLTSQDSEIAKTLQDAVRALDQSRDILTQLAAKPLDVLPPIPVAAQEVKPA